MALALRVHGLGKMGAVGTFVHVTAWIGAGSNSLTLGGRRVVLLDDNTVAEPCMNRREAAPVNPATVTNAFLADVSWLLLLCRPASMPLPLSLNLVQPAAIKQRATPQ